MNTAQVTEVLSHLQPVWVVTGYKHWAAATVARRDINRSTALGHASGGRAAASLSVSGKGRAAPRTPADHQVLGVFAFGSTLTYNLIRHL